MAIADTLVEWGAALGREIVQGAVAAVRAVRRAPKAPTMAESRRTMETDQQTQLDELKRILNERSKSGPT